MSCQSQDRLAIFMRLAAMSNFNLWLFGGINIICVYLPLKLPKMQNKKTLYLDCYIELEPHELNGLDKVIQQKHKV